MTLLLLVVGHWYSVVGLVSRGLLVIGRWSLVMVTIGGNSISMQLYERPKNGNKFVLISTFIFSNALNIKQ